MQRGLCTSFQPMVAAFLAGFFVSCLLYSGTLAAVAQSFQPSSLVETGQVSIAGREVSYRIRNLPVSSFPELPHAVVETLMARKCLIPQTYEAHRPENVVHASLERPGSSDWAVLCSAQGKVSLLIFFASASPTQPTVLAEAAMIDRLQAQDLSGVLGFNWGIDPASPKRIHEAQAGMEHRPVPPDHDCLADTTVDHQTVYHLYRDGAWEKVDVE
jgi:hypothetical protein